jgi:hypothetical protein
VEDPCGNSYRLLFAFLTLDDNRVPVIIPEHFTKPNLDAGTYPRFSEPLNGLSIPVKYIGAAQSSSPVEDLHLFHQFFIRGGSGPLHSSPVRDRVGRFPHGRSTLSHVSLWKEGGPIVKEIRENLEPRVE